MTYQGAKRIAVLTAIVFLLVSWCSISILVEPISNATSYQNLGFGLIVVVLIPLVALAAGYATMWWFKPTTYRGN